jgi:1-acyl-sn-glycerol-3-phosphate acyltransferase
MQLLRSLLFNIQIYIAMAVVGVVYLPWAMVSRRGAHAASHAYSRWVIWTAAWMVGLRTEIRGTPPEGQVLVAAKHQSFLDILAIYNAMPQGMFIMKAVLRYAPVIGQYAMRMGCIPVHRGKRGTAIKKMLAGVASGRQQGGQLIIYPQGTRVAPGEVRPYKIGTAALYQQMQQPCVPVATNVGVFWPKRGFLRKPGLAVFEFLPVIEPGLDRDVFLAQLEHAVETKSNELMAEAGFSRGKTP